MSRSATLRIPRREALGPRSLHLKGRGRVRKAEAKLASILLCLFLLVTVAISAVIAYKLHQMGQIIATLEAEYQSLNNQKKKLVDEENRLLAKDRIIGLAKKYHGLREPRPGQIISLD
ncbi:hypothetical protein [Thermosulfuriphilus sp.]